MNKVFEYNSIDGNLNDKVSGDLLTNNNVVLKNTEKGLSGYFNGGNSDIIPTLVSPTNKMSLVCNFKISQRNNGETMRIIDRLGTVGYTLQISKNGVLFFSIISNGGISITATGLYNDNVWHQVIVTYDTSLGSDNLKMYIDGKLNITGNKTDPITYIGSPNCIGSRNSTDRFVIGYINNVAIYETPLNEQEILQLYSKFLNTYPLTISKSNFYYPKPTSLDEDNLVAAYNMIPQSGELTDISGNGNNGTVIGALSSKDGMIFKSNINNEVNLDFHASTFNISKFSVITTFTKNAVSDSSSVFSGYTRISNFRAGFGFQQNGNRVIFGNGYSSTYKVFLNNKLDAAGTYHICMTYNNGDVEIYSENELIGSGTVPQYIANSKFRLGMHISEGVSSYFEGEIQDFYFFDEVVSSDLRTKFYDNFAKKINFFDKPQYEKADGTNIIPKEYIQGSGSYKVNTEIDGSQYYECTSNGTIAFQSKQAYGTWKFDLYTTSTSSNFIYFIDNSTDSDRYIIGFYSNGQLRLLKDDGGSISTLFETNSGDYSTGTWHTIKVIRSITGEFSVYVNNVLAIATTGTNPIIDTTHTTSKYTVLDLDSGSRIKNIENKN